MSFISSVSLNVLLMLLVCICLVVDYDIITDMRHAVLSVSLWWCRFMHLQDQLLEILMMSGGFRKLQKRVWKGSMLDVELYLW